MGVTAGIFLASILLKEMRYLVYIRYLWERVSKRSAQFNGGFGDAVFRTSAVHL
jgi:hypothetical protein